MKKRYINGSAHLYGDFAQQFKRSCLPDGPKVGSVAVSPRGDLRMPSDASSAAWIRKLDKIKEGMLED